MASKHRHLACAGARTFPLHAPRTASEPTHGSRTGGPIVSSLAPSSLPRSKPVQSQRALHETAASSRACPHLAAHPATPRIPSHHSPIAPRRPLRRFAGCELARRAVRRHGVPDAARVRARTPSRTHASKLHVWPSVPKTSVAQMSRIIARRTRAVLVLCSCCNRRIGKKKKEKKKPSKRRPTNLQHDALTSAPLIRCDALDRPLDPHGSKLFVNV